MGTNADVSSYSPETEMRYFSKKVWAPNAAGAAGISSCAQIGKGNPLGQALSCDLLVGRSRLAPAMGFGLGPSRCRDQ